MTETLTTEPPSASSRRRPVVRLIRGLGWASLVAGLLVLGFVAQQLFVTTWFAERAQRELQDRTIDYFVETADDFTEVDYVPPTTVPDEPEPEPVRILTEPAPPLHEPFAIIRIPKLEKLREGWTVVEGVERSDLRSGAGHMVQTPLPGQPGNSVISGHRTTYGAPFYDLDKLGPGDVIEVETTLGVHRYQVVESVVVRPNELWVTEPRDGAWLTLTTCEPRFSSRRRLVVFATLVGGPNAEAILGS
jgi:sortase A